MQDCEKFVLILIVVLVYRPYCVNNNIDIPIATIGGSKIISIRADTLNIYKTQNNNNTYIQIQLNALILISKQQT